MTIKKVLVVDDSPTDLANLVRIVSGTGCQVIIAGSGTEALSKAKTERPDIIFMDVVMKDVDGYEACRRLARDPATSAIPVIFVTSKNQRADRVWAMLQGGKDFISKPVVPERILNHLGDVQQARSTAAESVARSH
ncbi:MAG: response regulator [Chromatiales bacterium]